MVGIRRTDGAAGCPPTLTPPTDYVNPFRVDSVGALWIRQCFEEFRYFGAARHDIPVANRIIGSASCPVDVPGQIQSARGIPAGKYRNVTVTNDTEQPMQILLGLDATIDSITTISQYIVFSLIGRWNGVYQTSTGSSPPFVAFTNRTVRQQTNFSANAHDQIFEDSATETPAIVLQPGETGTVSAKLSVAYWDGSPDGRDVLSSAASAIRVYGHTI